MKIPIKEREAEHHFHKGRIYFVESAHYEAYKTLTDCVTLTPEHRKALETLGVEFEIQ